MTNSFDLYEPEIGHFDRFQSKLSKRNSNKKWKTYLKYGMVAGFALILGLSFTNFFNINEDLASVSPKMKQTQDFFEGHIEYEIAYIEKMKTTENSHLIEKGLEKLKKIESDYDKLKIELTKNGYNKSIINAMIMNYQQRIEVLQTIIVNIESKQNLNLTNNENNSI